MDGEKTYSKLAACINDIRNDMMYASFRMSVRFSSLF